MAQYWDELKREFCEIVNVCLSDILQQEDAESARRDALALFNYGLFVANTASGSSDSSTHLHNACVPLSLMSKLTRPRQSLPGLPQAHFQPDSFYHTSAILAGAIDSFSLVYRLSSNERVHLRDAVDAITPHQRKVRKGTSFRDTFRLFKLNIALWVIIQQS